MSVTTRAPSTSSTHDIVLSALEKVCGRALPDVDADTSLFHEIGVDSTGVMHLITCLADATGFDFDIEQLRMRDFATVGSLTSFVDRETQH
jgi:acyl carrier protein